MVGAAVRLRAAACRAGSPAWITAVLAQIVLSSFWPRVHPLFSASGPSISISRPIIASRPAIPASRPGRPNPSLLSRAAFRSRISSSFLSPFSVVLFLIWGGLFFGSRLGSFAAFLIIRVFACGLMRSLALLLSLVSFIALCFSRFTFAAFLDGRFYYIFAGSIIFFSISLSQQLYNSSFSFYPSPIWVPFSSAKPSNPI
jgi:hypothetical protein